MMFNKFKYTADHEKQWDELDRKYGPLKGFEDAKKQATNSFEQKQNSGGSARVVTGNNIRAELWGDAKARVSADRNRIDVTVGPNGRAILYRDEGFPWPTFGPGKYFVDQTMAGAAFDGDDIK